MKSGGNGFDARDLKIAEDIADIKARMENIGDDFREIRDKLRDYCKMNDTAHKSIWRRLDLHNRLIFIGVGILTVAGTIVGVALRAIHKLQ